MIVDGVCRVLWEKYWSVSREGYDLYICGVSINGFIGDIFKYRIKCEDFKKWMWILVFMKKLYERNIWI